MKRTLLLFGILFVTALTVSAQTITLNPPFFEEDEQIEIVVDFPTAQADWGVSDLYLWAWHFDSNNIQINNPTATGTDFFDSPETARFTNNGDGTYSYFLTPTTFYANTGINTIGFLVKSQDGTEQTSDFLRDVGRVKIEFNNPTESVVLVQSGDDLNVSANIVFQGSTTVQGSYELYFNNNLVDSGSCGFPACNGTISSAAITGNGEVRFVGTAPNTTPAETGEGKFDVLLVPSNLDQAMPAGMKDGINYDTNDATKATLVLNAPKKDYVLVNGSFNGYNPSNAQFMRKDPTSGKYWLELTGLTPGQIETYQYWVFDQSPFTNSPGLVKTADPYSTLVLSPFDDPGIPATTYPNLPTYPAGQEREVTVLQTGQTPYNWQVTNFVKPKKEDLVIYEVLVRDFDANRSYQDLIDRIDYFKNLNVNAIQLMPVMEFEGNESWGYNTSFHMALDKFYGTEDKFKEFVDLCHQNGIAVILDIALNHAFGRNPLVRMWMNDPDGDGWGGPSFENPYFNQVPQHSYNVGSDFSHTEEEPNDPGASSNDSTNPITNAYVERVIEHWITEFKIDGFRWDLTKGFTQNCENNQGCTDGYQQDRVDILRAYADYSWSLDETHYVIFEHLGSDGEEQQWANYRINDPVSKGIMMWGKMTNEYTDLLQGFSNNINRAGHVSRGFSEPRIIGYPESHDEERMMYEAVVFGNDSNGSHNVRDLNTALSRMPALGAVNLTIPGPKMLWHFGPLGMDNSIFTCTDGSVNNVGDGCKLDTKPQPQWVENWQSDPNRTQIYDAWARLIDLRINEPVFEGDYAITANGQLQRIDVFDTSIPTSSLRNVVVLANFDVVTRNVDTNFPLGGDWYDLMDETGSTTYSASNINIPAGQFRIFGNQPPSTLSAESFDTNTFSIYPNPVNTSFSTNKAVSSLQIFDITGKLVKSFKGDFTENDTYDISELTQSIYLVKIENQSGQTLTSKLIKL
ncbi:alpha-amylase family glycosyl hydrolase [Psychroserpens sp.]|uniref:alpha-amylase family glycosyl hydrolase n=1 Tax=Psychroserpens sp. TaxID=2020870 RepID=UPI001B180576|nr:alpha-amylase family glycosyl hydrolase [Psychroserpens sp.]MBO6605730.1 T9SS type A sorting domain-containing protein [Psychroserpens sp.]MBO6652899.1 T9SS type A sorting domain-containing protein [Psychroserpens sp.]MBO6681329.1 T9SS type A sorting domain-containing protein [Psychroserpens sp.]MBO6749104.1 T9SS type A sorting domain-containing protein [Psychroserpens sp.]MBO6914450.1 T9SS type A sorting domain-containing protein [Psychroserpens sp.]